MKKLNLLLVATIMILLSSLAGFTQKSGALRVEIEPKWYSASYNIVPLGKNGLIVFYETSEKSKGNRQWIFSKYNTDLKEEWSKEVPVNKYNDAIEYYFDTKENNVYILTAKNQGTKMISPLIPNKIRGGFQIIKFNTITGDYNITNSVFKDTYAINSFKVINGNAFMTAITQPDYIDGCFQTCLTMTCIPAFTGLTVFHFNSYMIKVDLESGATTTNHLKYKGNTFVLGSQVVEDEAENLRLLVRNKLNKKTTDQYFYDYSADGDLISKTKIKIAAGKEISSAKYQKTGKDEAMVFGTYSQPKKIGFTFNPASPKAMGIDNPSSGIYVSKFKGETMDYMNFYPFAKFENFFSFLSKTSKKRVDKYIKKKESKGKDVNVSYDILVHDVIEKDGEYIMIGEAYYPEFHTECYYTVGADGKMQRTCVTVFDGYRYTHAVVAGFDKEGEKLWDNCFEIADILTYNLKERVKVMHDGDNIVLAYNYGGEIKSKIISGNSVVEGKTSTKIETSKSGDKVKADWASDMEYWYDDYYIAWGYERIKAKDKKKRTVFYFNKIGLE